MVGKNAELLGADAPHYAWSPRARGANAKLVPLTKGLRGRLTAQ